MQIFRNQTLIETHDNQDQNLSMDSILSRTHELIIRGLKEGKSLESQSQAIRQILTEAFQNAIASEEQHYIKDIFISELTQANEELLEKIELIGKQHEILKNKYGTLRDESSNYQQAIQTVSEQAQASEQEIVLLRTQANTLNINYSDLKNKYDNVEEQYDLLNIENQKLTSESSTLKNNFADLEKNCRQLDKENKKYKDRSESLSQKCIQLEIKYDHLNAETISFRNSFDKLTKNYSNLQNLFTQVVEQAKLRDAHHRSKGDKGNDAFNYLKIWHMISKYTWEALPYPLQILYQFGKSYCSPKEQK